MRRRSVGAVLTRVDEWTEAKQDAQKLLELESHNVGNLV